MAMGYQGLAQIGSKALPAAGIDGGYINLLITGSSINMALEPIYSSAIWGAGWYNAAATVNYADNVVRFEGGLDFELQASRNAWNLVRDWCIESRAYSRAARITPDGSWIYCYTLKDAIGGEYWPQDPTDPSTYTTQERLRKGLWARGLSLNTSEGNFVTGSIDCVALERFVYGPDDAHTFAGQLIDPSLTGIASPGGVSYVQDKFGLSNPNRPLNPGGLNYDPIPYWRTTAYVCRDWVPCRIGPDSGHLIATETVEWSVDLANNTLILYTCRGVRGASAVLQGAIDATGSVTLYNPYGVFDPVFGAPGIGSWTTGDSPYTLENPCFYADNTQFVAVVTGANVGIVLPAIVLESDDYGIRGQNEVTNRTFNIKGLGGKKLGDTNTGLGTFSSFVNTNFGLPISVSYTPNDMSPGHPLPAGSNLTNLALPPMVMSLAT